MLPESRLDRADHRCTARDTGCLRFPLSQRCARLRARSQQGQKDTPQTHRHQCIQRPTRIDVAIQYHSGADTAVVSYVNNHRTLDGGTHVAGLYAALGRVLNALGPRTGIPWKGVLAKRDIASGLCTVVSVWVVEPMTNTSENRLRHVFLAYVAVTRGPGGRFPRPGM